MLKTFEDFLKYVIFFYSTIGVEPYHRDGQSLRRKTLNTLIFYISFTNLHCTASFEVLYVIISLINNENSLDVIMAMSYLSVTVVTSFKTFIVWRQKSAITNIIQDIKKIFPKNLQAQHEYQLGQYLRQCLRLSLGFASICMIAVWTHNLMPISQYLIETKIQNKLNVTEKFPYYMYIFWDLRANLWSYYLLYALHISAGYTAIVGQFSSDLLLCSLVAQLVMHFQYVAYMLTNYEMKLPQSNMAKALMHAKNIAFLQKIIEYHTLLLHLSERLNDIFGWPLLVTFNSSAFVICFLGFLMTVGSSLLDLFKLALFLILMLSQVALICYYGQLLIDTSINVSEAVYNQNWFNADVRYQKMLVLMAKRAQKPAQLKATTFVLISRGTMTELMQLSYKFFALLRTMYHR